MAKKSLLSGSEFESIGRKGGGGGGGASSQDKIKIGLAAGLLVVAGLILAWHFGLFAGNSLPADYEPLPPEVVEQAQEEFRIMEERIEAGEIERPATE